MKQDYTDLTPETILDAVEFLGYETSGRLLALNSYENRVYRCDLETGGAVIAKFYRPGRWSDQAIAEEHQFALELLEKKHLLIAPGSSFNVPYRNHFRLTTLPTGRKMETVFERMDEVLESMAR